MECASVRVDCVSVRVERASERTRGQATRTLARPTRELFTRTEISVFETIFLGMQWDNQRRALAQGLPELYFTTSGIQLTLLERVPRDP